MCGIIGYIGDKRAIPRLIEGLRRLEYRGYDSAGVAVHQGGELKRARSTSRVAELEGSTAADGISAGTGIARRSADTAADRIGVRAAPCTCASSWMLACGSALTSDLEVPKDAEEARASVRLFDSTSAADAPTAVRPAASTHDGEEALLLDAFMRSSPTWPARIPASSWWPTPNG